MEELHKIDFLKDYLITKSGKLYSVKNKKYLKPIRRARGYYAFIIYENGKRKQYFRHWLLCKVFKDKPNSHLMTVDHINTIPGDDNLDNIEFVFHKTNVQRYWKKRIRKEHANIIVRDLLKMEDTIYENKLQFAKIHNIDPDIVDQRLHSKFGKVHTDYKQYKFLNDKREFPLIDNLDKARDAGSNKHKVLIKNLYTDKIMEFDRMKDASNYLGVKQSALTGIIKRNDVYPGGYQIKMYNEENIEWLNLSKDEVDIAVTKYGRNKYVLIIDNKNQEYVFSEAKKAAEFLNLLPTTLNYRLKHKEGILNNDGTICKYVNA